MLYFIGDSAKRITWHSYCDNGVARVKEVSTVLGAMGIAQKMGMELNDKGLVTFVCSDKGDTYGIPANENISDWSIDSRQVVTEDFVILYDLDVASRQQIPKTSGTTIACLKARNLHLLKNTTLRDAKKLNRFL